MGDGMHVLYGQITSGTPTESQDFGDIEIDALQKEVQTRWDGFTATVRARQRRGGLENSCCKLSRFRLVRC